MAGITVREQQQNVNCCKKSSDWGSAHWFDRVTVIREKYNIFVERSQGVLKKFCIAIREL